MEAIPVPEESLASLVPTTPSLDTPLSCPLGTERVPGGPVLARQHASSSSSGPVLVRSECEITGAEAGV